MSAYAEETEERSVDIPPIELKRKPELTQRDEQPTSSRQTSGTHFENEASTSLSREVLDDKVLEEICDELSLVEGW